MRMSRATAAEGSHRASPGMAGAPNTWSHWALTVCGGAWPLSDAWPFRVAEEWRGGGAWRRAGWWRRGHAAVAGWSAQACLGCRAKWLGRCGCGCAPIEHAVGMGRWLTAGRTRFMCMSAAWSSPRSVKEGAASNSARCVALEVTCARCCVAWVHSPSRGPAAPASTVQDPRSRSERHKHLSAPRPSCGSPCRPTCHCN